MISNLDLLGFYSKEKWINQHTDNVETSNFFDHSRYHKEFKNFLKKEEHSDETARLLQIQKKRFGLNAHQIDREFLGPCFGVSLALADHYICKRNFPFFETNEEVKTFNQRACYYTLLDLTIAKCKEISKKKVELTEEETQLINHSKERKFKGFKTNDYTKNEFFAEIGSLLSQLENRVVLLRVWNEEKMQIPSLNPNERKVFPHSILICLDDEKNNFFILETSIKAVIKAQEKKELISLFINYISEAQPHYLKKGTVFGFQQRTFYENF